MTPRPTKLPLVYWLVVSLFVAFALGVVWAAWTEPPAWSAATEQLDSR